MAHDETQYVSRLREAMLKSREKKTKEQLLDELREIEEQIECEKLKAEIKRKKQELEHLRTPSVLHTDFLGGFGLAVLNETIKGGAMQTISSSELKEIHGGLFHGHPTKILPTNFVMFHCGEFKPIG